MYDSEPDKILAYQKERDAYLITDDRFMFILDTFLDGRTGYFFEINPAGLRGDGLIGSTGGGGFRGFGTNRAWDGIWDARVMRRADGWSAEIRIPFSTLNFNPSQTQWGINFQRTIRRKNEETLWTGYRQNQQLTRPVFAGVLSGLNGMSQGLGLEVVPYAVTGWRNTPVDDPALANIDETDFPVDAGFDVSYNVTPSLRAAVTVNTDFAQVEVDERQLNLTRFSLFFPEKRPFFLENAGVFSVGTPRAGSDLGLDLFYSRRIGLSDGGLEIPMLGGARVTGKVGGVTVGAMSMQTGRDDALGVPTNNYSVVRVLQELPNRSQLGVMFVSRLNSDSTGDYNLAYNVDGRLGIGESVNLDGYAALTTTPSRTGRNHGMGLTASFITRDWDLGLQYRDIGEDFNPEVGFLPRTAYRAFIGRAQRMIRVPRIRWMRELRPHVLLRNFYDFDWFHETRYLHIDFAGELESGGFFSFATNVRREGLKDPFEISDGVIIPPNTYDFTEARVRFSTNASAVWALSGDVTVGGFYSGHRKSYVGELTNRIGSTWVGALRMIHNDVDLADGAFNNTLVGAKLAYSFTPRIFLQALVQYSTDDADVSANVRFGWLDTAGTGLYLVYNEIQRMESPLGPVERAFIIKYTRQFNVVR
jgi:hypothetical protein